MKWARRTMFEFGDKMLKCYMSSSLKHQACSHQLRWMLVDVYMLYHDMLFQLEMEWAWRTMFKVGDEMLKCYMLSSLKHQSCNYPLRCMLADVCYVISARDEVCVGNTT